MNDRRAGRLRPWAWAAVSLLGAFLIAYPILFSELPYRVTLAFSILVFVVLAESYDIVGGHMGYPNLGHTVFFAIGAYSFGIAITNGAPLLMAFLIAGSAAVIFAAAISYPIFRVRGMYFAIATLGLTGLLNILAFNVSRLTVTIPFTGRSVSLGTGGSFGMVLSMGNAARQAYWAALALAVGTIALNLWVARSKLGLALFSIREDEESAVVFGVRLQRYKTLALVMSSLPAGLIGAVFLWKNSYIEPFTVLGREIVLIPVVMAMLGGSGLTIGPLVGAVFIMLVQEVVFIRIEHYHLAVYGLILAAVGLFMPGGVARQRWFVRAGRALDRLMRAPARRLPEESSQ